MKRARTIGSLALVGAAALAGVWLVTKALRTDRQARDSARLLETVMARVQRNFVDSVDSERLWELAMLGMVDELGDPNTAYLTPERLAALERTASNTYVGVGLTVDTRNGWVVVTAPRVGSPAERAGLLPGDRLVEVDGRSMRGWTVAEARQAFRGPPGSSLKLVVERGSGANARHLYTLERAEIVARSVARATVLDGGVGYLAVSTFSDSTVVEMVSVVDSLRAAGARALVVDLRDNPGGLLAQGVQFADLFLAPGQRILSTKGRVAQANTVYTDSTPERWSGLPVALLVNHLTASAAEIVAGALQDHDRALIVGRATYGKGSAQAIYRLENGAALSLTNARWETPLGRSIEYPLDGEEPLRDAQPVRPEFKTAMGRTVLGGGGIVPDVAAGDSAADVAERRFNIELGGRVEAWRNLARATSVSIAHEGQVRDSLFAIAPAWRDRLYRAMVREGMPVSVETFGGAQALVDRWLGNEIARTLYGSAYVARRNARLDATVQRAADALRRAKSTRELLAVD